MSKLLDSQLQYYKNVWGEGLRTVNGDPTDTYLEHADTIKGKSVYNTLRGD